MVKREETHCVVFENPNGSSFENSGAIFPNARRDKLFFRIYLLLIEDGLEGGGTPILLILVKLILIKIHSLYLYNLRVKETKEVC